MTKNYIKEEVRHIPVEVRSEQRQSEGTREEEGEGGEKKETSAAGSKRARREVGGEEQQRSTESGSEEQREEKSSEEQPKEAKSEKGEKKEKAKQASGENNVTGNLVAILGGAESMNEKFDLIKNKYKNSVQLINKGQEDEAICYGYRTNICKSLICYLLVLLTGGVFYLLFYWKPEWKIFFTCSLSDLSDSNYVVLQDKYKRYFAVGVKSEHIEEEDLSQIEKGYQSGYGAYESLSDSIQQTRTDLNASQQNLIPNGNAKKPLGIRYFEFQTLRYGWNGAKVVFEKITGYDQKTPCIKLLKEFHGYNSQEQAVKLKFYGQNSIEVQVKSYFRLFFEEILTPFYIFQIMACALWLVDNYILYACCIIIISLISMVVSLVETKRQAQTLHDMVKTNITVNVCRKKDIFERIPSELLVPGDIIEIESHETTMACDAVLLNGVCIVNESMLTGESVPVIKSPLSQPEDLDEIYDVEVHKRNTLFNGTRVVQTRNYENSKVLALVVRTGFSTSKGDLVRSILFPKPMDFKFYQDSLKFILFLFVVAIFGMTYGIVILANKGVDVRDIVIRALDIITIVVPPALPAAMTVGTVYAQNRLKKKLIYCISPPRIPIGGKLKLVCFDKTGTLTEDGLDLWGVVELDYKHKAFKHPQHNVSELHDSSLLRSLATCHSLSKFNGQLTGDPLDVKMFESTKWHFIDEHITGSSKFEQVTPVVKKDKTKTEEEVEIAIVKQFTFSSSFLRMSVLCKALDRNCMDVYTKGAPEKIVELCKPETVPHNFNQVLKAYTANGYRVIALAGKSLDPSTTWLQSLKLSRDSIESDLDFYGFLIMQNMIKPETTPVIDELKAAGITSVMITGDNLLTALCVAKKCNMVEKHHKVVLVEAHLSNEDGDQNATNSVPPRIEWKLVENYDDQSLDENTEFSYQSQSYAIRESAINIEPGDDSYNFAMTGKTFGILRKSFPKVFEKILVNGTIYARMSPDQKAQLVEHLISIGYCVSMCGDGANDCGALKAAHVGISLSEAEASVASPFTSKIQNISCVPQVIKEGRAALVTSFGVFKYMALYSMIQFTSVLILYTFLTNLADPQFLYVDLFLITPVAVFMSANKAYDSIAKKRPLGSLVGFVNVCSIIFQILLVAAFQIGTFVYLKFQPWYVPNHPDKDHFKDGNNCMEGTAVFLISTFQYVIMAFVFSKGPPYRMGISDNFFFVATLLVLTASNIWITFSPIPKIRDLLSMKELDPNNPISFFRGSIVGVALAFFLTSYAIEELVVSSEWFKKIGKVILRKKHPKNKYKIIKQDIQKDSQWPYIGKITF